MNDELLLQEGATPTEIGGKVTLEPISDEELELVTGGTMVNS